MSRIIQHYILDSSQAFVFPTLISSWERNQLTGILLLISFFQHNNIISFRQCRKLSYTRLEFKFNVEALKTKASEDIDIKIPSFQALDFEEQTRG
jgi:predicted permease